MNIMDSDLSNNDAKTMDFIKSCINVRKILWTYHVNMRLDERFISRGNIINSCDTFEIIERYPFDKYFPSYLIYARYGEKIFHIQIATDLQNERVIVITAYRPAQEKWEKNFKIRRLL